MRQRPTIRELNSSDTNKLIWSHAAFLTLTPLAALILIPIHHIYIGFKLSLILSAIGLWVLTGVAITAGYHRLFAHKSYQASPWFRYLMLAAGAASWQNSAITWASNHRYHHQFVDTDKDPYNAKRGFWFSHMGWIMFEARYDAGFVNVPDLWKDRACRLQHTYYWHLNLGLNLLVPILLGLVVHDVIGMLIYAGLVRLVAVHHFTFTINSFAHIWGTQPWSSRNTSRDSWLLSLLSFGEGYHNFHHTFQNDYRNGPKWYNYDPSKWLIWTLATVGVTTKLRRTPKKLMYPFREQVTSISYATSSDSNKPRTVLVKTA